MIESLFSPSWRYPCANTTHPPALLRKCHLTSVTTFIIIVMTWQLLNDIYYIWVKLSKTYRYITVYWVDICLYFTSASYLDHFLLCLTQTYQEIYGWIIQCWTRDFFWPDPFRPVVFLTQPFPRVGLGFRDESRRVASSNTGLSIFCQTFLSRKNSC